MTTYSRKHFTGTDDPFDDDKDALIMEPFSAYIKVLRAQVEASKNRVPSPEL